ncbi:tetratricopeptide repeat protein [Candidatus Acidulodesulfobacterium sp. H_13]|uniref:tetratricopeptide repeat protein n=1 Tax=Candidatus Acidulodesulfobacterium sp. H_13 TaxID=3395470 RepID=UPI003AF99D73
MNKIILIAISLVTEYYAVISLLNGGAYWASIIDFFCLHALSALCISLAMYYEIPKKFGKSIVRNILVSFPLFFFLPVMEFFAFILFILLFKKQKTIHRESLSINPEEELDFKIFPSLNRQYGEGSIISRLADPNASSKLKQSSLLYLINKNPTVSYDFVRDNMRHRSNEVRLLAFSLLSKKENEINKKIFSLKNTLSDEKERDSGKLHFELAYLYWNLVYMNISDKEFEKYNLEISMKYILKAMNKKYRYYESAFLLGRISAKLKDYKEAERYFKDALALDALQDKVIPYLAEVYYITKDYKKAKELFDKISSPVINNKLKNIVELWVG